MSDAKRSTGTIAANAQTVTLSPNGRSVVGLVLTGAWSINIDVKALIDGTEQDAVIVDKSGAAVSLPLTTNQVAYIDAVGREQIIVRANGYTSGTAAVTMNATDGKLPSATGGSAVSIADGSDATFGAKADAAAGSDAGTFTFMALFKRLLQKFTTQFPAALGGTTAANSLAVTLASDGTYATLAGGVTEAAPATDTASSGANGRLQRIAQRLTSLIALLPAALVSGRLDVNVGATVTPANVALDATVTTTNTEIGGLTEAAPASDTASSGLNGRLQRVAQRLTSLIALLPSALISNRLDVNLGAAPATVTANATLQAATVAAGNVGGLTKTVSSVLTRPANTTTYTANDEMTDTGGTIRTLTGMATATGGKGIITHCLLSCSSNGGTKPTYTVYVYDTTSTPQTDNAAFAPSDGVQDTCIGSFTLTTAEVGDATANTGNFTMDSGPIHLPYTTVGSADLYFRVKVTNGYTPGANSDTNTFRFKAQQDAN
jgi:hypothetical protein